MGSAWKFAANRLWVTIERCSRPKCASALKNAGLVILTGGLGPTEDDVTRDAVSDALGRPLVFRQDLLDTLLERFQRLNRKMADNNRRQTYAIEGADPLPNPRGTAAGQWIECGTASDGRVVMLLPGPPHELKAMFGPSACRV